MPNGTPVIFEAKALSKTFGNGIHKLKAVDEVSFKIHEQEVVSIVGESGCGKTVLAKLLLRLEKPTSGDLLFRGKSLLKDRDYLSYWRQVQTVFQDPFSAFNQFYTIRSQLKSSFHLLETQVSDREMEQRVDEALLAVNIKPNEIEGKYPFELSGGQMQRMLLARVFILRPKVLIADEPTSMVDASSRSSILDYLLKLKQELNMTIVFITHDIGLAYYISDSIYIMHHGKLIEQGTPDDVMLHPKDIVTRKLLEDIPQLHKSWIPRGGTHESAS